MTDPRQLYALALAAFDRHDWEHVLRLSGEVARLWPDDAESRYLLGVAALQSGRLPLALQALSDAGRLAPGRLQIIAQYARVLTVAGDTVHAVEVARSGLPLIDAADADAVSCDTLGNVFTQAGCHAEAARVTRRAVALEPAHAGYRFNLASVLMFEGDFTRAERECENCLAIDPGYWRAWFSLAQLRRQTPQCNHVERLARLLQQGTSDSETQLYLHMALGKELEDLGNAPDAFEHYVAGKAAHRARLHYTPERDRRLFEAIMHAYTALPRVQEPGWHDSAPIFVVGMPRSGTTLVERILGAHSDVAAAGELNAFERVLRRHAMPRAVALMDVANEIADKPPDWSAVGRDYVAEARVAVGYRSPRFTDKLPHNFLFLGFISRALPNARIVVVKRNPLDACLGNLRQIFATDSPRFDYSYDLLDIGRYWLGFERLTAFWERELGDRIHMVSYEALVTLPDDTTRALLDACGLVWEAQVLRPELTDVPVATASAVQARAPITRDFVARWKRFAPQLMELRKLLENHGVSVT